LATKATKTKEIELANGETIVVKQLVISNLRRALEAFEPINERDVEQNGEKVTLPAENPLDVYISTLAVCVEDHAKAYVEGKLFTDASKKTPTKSYREWLESQFDTDAIEDTLLVTAGIDLSVMRDFQERMRELALAQLGQSSTS
jgi:hypothetical protein